MAFWKSKQPSNTTSQRRDWSTGPIEPDPDRLKSAPYQLPNWLEVANQIIARSGRNPSEVNTIEVMMMVGRVVIGETKFYMSRLGKMLEENEEQLDEVASRPDFDFEILSNYLTYCGPYGLAIIDKLARNLKSEAWLENIAELVRDGNADHAVSGE